MFIDWKLIQEPAIVVWTRKMKNCSPSKVRQFRQSKQFSRQLWWCDSYCASKKSDFSCGAEGFHASVHHLNTASNYCAAHYCYCWWRHVSVKWDRQALYHNTLAQHISFSGPIDSPTKMHQERSSSVRLVIKKLEYTYHVWCITLFCHCQCNSQCNSLTLKLTYNSSACI